MSDSKKALTENIETFFGFFEKQLAAIANIDGDSQELFQKILYVSLIDALSVSIFPRKSNRDRFVFAVRQFAPRDYWDKVSIPHLHRLLHVLPDPAYEQLRREVNSDLSDWPHDGGPIPVSRDLDLAHIRKAARLKLSGTSVSLESLTHIHLLWSCRNRLVHELRGSGYGMEVSDRDEPYYLGVTDIDATDCEDRNSVSLELVYPGAFLHDVCKSMLTGLRGYFTSNELDPYQSYTFGSHWLKELQ